MADKKRAVANKKKGQGKKLRPEYVAYIVLGVLAVVVVVLMIVLFASTSGSSGGGTQVLPCCE